MPFVSKIIVPGFPGNRVVSPYAREMDNAVMCHSLHSARVKWKAHCISEGVIQP